jgi:hypothetical protein
VTDRGQHLADDTLSSLVDQQLGHAELAHAQSHVQSCPACQVRLDELSSVVSLLRALPTVLPPRDFRLAAQPRLRLVADPPNVIRLRRWYSVARAGVASLAAAFVFLSVGALYVDSQPATSTAASSVARSQDAGSQPGAVPAASPPAVAVRAAAPATNSDTAADQTAAATSVRALPTPSPLRPALSPPPQTTAPTPTNSAAPLRVAAALVGALAALSLLLTLVVRHRLKAATP